MSEYYVYAILDTRKSSEWKKEDYVFPYEPYYIGHGKGNRDTWHLLLSVQSFDTNRLKINITNAIRKEGYEPLVVRIFEGMTKEEAAIEEKKAIATIGRRDLKLGPLSNMTNGGDGGLPGMIRSPVSEEIKRKISISKTGSVVSEETKEKIRESMKGDRNPMFGKNHSSETKEKISKIVKEKFSTLETREKLSESKKGIKQSTESKKKKSQATKKMWKSPEHRENMRNKHLGDLNGFYGKTHSDEVRKLISESNKWENLSEEEVDLRKIRLKDKRRTEIFKTISVLLSNNLEFNKENYNISRYHRGIRKFSDIYKDVSKEEVKHFIDNFTVVD